MQMFQMKKQRHSLHLCAIGGHSTGGNLAVYAAMRCSPALQERIGAVYSNDGPGLCADIVDLEEYQNIAPKVIRIVPEFSVIGALFEQERPSRIVASSAAGFMQHDGQTWQVAGNRFCEMAERSERCRFCNEIFDTWIESVSMEQQKAFTNDFFDSLRAGGVTPLVFRGCSLPRMRESSALGSSCSASSASPPVSIAMAKNRPRTEINNSETKRKQ